MSDRPHIATLNPAPAHAHPADANVSWEWITEVLKPIGLGVVVVQCAMEATEPAPLALHKQIGSKLQAENLGQLDSFKIGNPTHFFFLVGNSRIAQALQIILRELAAAGLMDHCKVAHADPAERVWRAASIQAGGQQ
jgi:hypothetical protein